MAKICLCLTAKTVKRNLEILNKYRKYADLAELRVDCLEPDERLLIRSFPEQAGLPVILAIRRKSDGGFFDSGEGSRINLMARGLAYADADRRLNYAYLEIEEDLNVPSLEEAARTFGTKIIRSYHNITGVEAELPAKIRRMRHSADEIIKIMAMAHSIGDVLTLLRTGKEYAGQEKIFIAVGPFGICSRIIAEQFGSFLSYAYPFSEPDVPPAVQGQVDIVELAQIYRFHNISGVTKVCGITGFPFTAAQSLRFFNTIFGIEELDAVLVPFPADSITGCLELMRELNVQCLSVMSPHKQAILPLLDSQSEDVRRIGACNTLIMGPKGWQGTNTDTMGFADYLRKFTGKSKLRWRRATVIGAGGSARAVAYVLNRLEAKALILNRNVQKARELAASYKFAWGGLDSQGIAQMGKYNDIIIQTTPMGMEGHDAGDPLAMYSFSGKETVMDLVYQPEMTAFLARAADAGCRVQNGSDLLLREAKYQYAGFTGKEFPEHLVSRIRLDA